AGTLAMGDLDGDSRLDLAIANEGASRVSGLLGNGDGSFGGKNDYRTGDGPVALAIGDLNNDGKPDLAVANFGPGSVAVLLNIATDWPTATQLSLFEGMWTREGIELRWQFTEPRNFISSHLERSDAGTWSVVQSERHSEGEYAIFLDRGVEPGRAYYYRLVATQQDGSLTIFGPLVVTVSGSLNQIELLSVAPSPTR